MRGLFVELLILRAVYSILTISQGPREYLCPIDKYLLILATDFPDLVYRKWCFTTVYYYRLYM